MSSHALSPKQSGAEIEAIVCDRIPQLTFVSDRVAEWFDARVDGPIGPTDQLRFVDVDELDDEDVVEIKAAHIEYANNRSGRWYIRKRQHERLLEEGGHYLLAVYGVRGLEHQVLAMAVAPAETVDDLISDGWTIRADRAEEGYRQLAWTRVFNPEDVI